MNWKKRGRKQVLLRFSWTNWIKEEEDDDDDDEEDDDDEVEEKGGGREGERGKEET
jgi:hypothetical protein